MAEKSKSAKDCERDLMNKAQVATLHLFDFSFPAFEYGPEVCFMTRRQQHSDVLLAFSRCDALI